MFTKHGNCIQHCMAEQAYKLTLYNQATLNTL